MGVARFLSSTVKSPNKENTKGLGLDSVAFCGEGEVGRQIQDPDFQV